jgi:hypothetical protein
MNLFRSGVTIIWWTEGGLTWKWRWMSASAGGRPNMWAVVMHECQVMTLLLGEARV